MKRAFSSGALGTPPSVPASPSEGYPTSGNPSSAVPATKPGAYWYHMITEELLAVIVAAGLTPALNTLTQLRDALYVLFARLGIANLWTKAQRGQELALPATTGSVVLDLDTSNNFGGTLTGNITLANPTNIVPGQSGVIRIVNDSTARTIAYGSYWKGTAGALPGLTAASGATDLLGYYVESATRIWIGAQGDSK